MGNNQNVIELNGKKYDARTGKMLSGKSSSHAHVARSVDGVMHHPKKKATHVHVEHAGKPHTPAHHKSHSKAPSSHRKAQRAKTLVRKSVHKPELQSVSLDAIPADADISMQAIVPKADPGRVKRAQKIRKSSSITRFNVASGTYEPPHQVHKKTAELEVKEAPEHAHPTKHKAPAKPVHPKHQTAAEEQFTKAMNASHAHEGKKTHKKRRSISRSVGVSKRALSAGTVALAALLLMGFVAYQNVPNLSLRVASSRAGFDAHMPGYQPSGFSMTGPIEYGAGYITLNFHSNSDERNFHVTQKVSNWTSETLEDNFLAANDTQYQTVKDKGKTIYIYEGSNATWVSGGVWYQIEGNSSLSSDQLVRIANSI